MVAGYNEQGQYVDQQGNPSPDPRTGDMAPGMSQAISNFFGLPYTPGSRTPPAYMGAEEQQHWDSALPHDATALATGRSGGGTFMPIQKGATGAPTPALGIQAGTREEDIDQEAGGMGEVLANIPGMYDDLDPMDASDNLAPTSPLAGVKHTRKPTPPQTDFPYTDPNSPNPIDQLVTADPQALIKSVTDTSAPDITATMSPKDAAAYNKGLQGVDTYLSGQAPNLDLPADNPGSRLVDWLSELMGRDVDTAMAPSEAGTYAPRPTEQAGPNIVPPTGDDAGDLRGERRPMNEAEYMENVVQGGNQQTTRPAPGAGSVRPTVPVNESPLIGADSPMLKQLMQMIFQSVPPSMNPATGPVGAAGSGANADALMKRYMGAVGG